MTEYLINLIVIVNDYFLLGSFLPTIFQLLLQRFSKRQSLAYVRLFVPFLGLFASLHGGDALLPIVDGVQPGLWTMVCEQIYTKVRRQSKSKT